MRPLAWALRPLHYPRRVVVVGVESWISAPQTAGIQVQRVPEPPAIDLIVWVLWVVVAVEVVAAWVASVSLEHSIGLGGTGQEVVRSFSGVGHLLGLDSSLSLPVAGQE
jgi:hypothetical protein